MALSCYAGFLLLLVVNQSQAAFEVSEKDITVHINTVKDIKLTLTKPLTSNATVSIDIQHPDLVSAQPSKFNVTIGESAWDIIIKGLNAGHSIVSANVTPNNITEMNTASLLRVMCPAFSLSRNLNCWTAGITKKHRKIYERTYLTRLVYPDGSSINIDYHQPRQLIRLPLDLSLLTEEQRKLRLMKRVPKTKIVIQEEDDDLDFDESKYIKMKK